ncbi:hypothetical protein WR25_12860, partial [Diploscapter pachys]
MEMKLDPRRERDFRRILLSYVNSSDSEAAVIKYEGRNEARWIHNKLENEAPFKGQLKGLRFRFPSVFYIFKTDGSSVSRPDHPTHFSLSETMKAELIRFFNHLDAMKRRAEGERRKALEMDETGEIVFDAEIDPYIPENATITGIEESMHSRESARAKPSKIPPMATASSEMNNYRKQLPAYTKRGDVLRVIEANQVTIVTGGTGCGKSTQVPQYIIEDSAAKNRQASIHLTQPRRIPAIAIAERIAEERGERIPSTVGYHIRLNRRIDNEKCCLTVCTNGILLRKLANDPTLLEATHVIIDEIHERELNSDFILLLLRIALLNRPDLKVILMSATMESLVDQLIQYFESQKIRVGKVNIPSRMFTIDTFHLGDIVALTNYLPEEKDRPINEDLSDEGQVDMEQLRREVEKSLPGRKSAFDQFSRIQLDEARMTEEKETYLAKIYERSGGINFTEGIDTELTFRIIKYIYDSAVDGAILVFLPGVDSINKLWERLEKEWPSSSDDSPSTSSNGPMIFMLHSQMNSIDQLEAVNGKAENGQRRIILSTNIAESSLTIEDAVFVVDCGRVKEMSYEQDYRISNLTEIKIAQSNAEQRKGRAGRCRKGFCFRLYSNGDFKGMEQAQKPQMETNLLHEVALNAKLHPFYNMTAAQLLSMTLNPPKLVDVRTSLRYLEEIGAVYSPYSSSNAYEFDKNSFDENADIRTIDWSKYEEQAITHLGRLLAQLPISVEYGRMLLYSAVFRCLNPIASLVAIQSAGNLELVVSKEKEVAARKVRDHYAANQMSDHLVKLRFFYDFARLADKSDQVKFCREKFLNFNTLTMAIGIRNQIIQELERIGILNDQGRNTGSMLNDKRYNEYAKNWPMVQAAIAAGLSSSVGWRMNAQSSDIMNRSPTPASFHSRSSLNRQLFRSRSENVSIPNTDYFIFDELTRTTKGLA